MNRQWLASLADFLIFHKIRHLVVSPGSRSAPLVLHLTNNSQIQVIIHVDERSAGFMALGMAQQMQSPVGLVCTSGTALLNYGPAIAEAYYQKVPLLILSADRPPEWIDQADGQSMRQHDVFHNFIRKSISLPTDGEKPEDEWFLWRQLSEGIRALNYPVPGPVHINIPFREPLYRLEEKSTTKPKFIETIPTTRTLDEQSWITIENKIKKFKKILFIVGLSAPGIINKKNLKSISDLPQIVVLSDITSNLYDSEFIPASDDFFALVQKMENDELYPDLILSLGEAVISKRMKEWLRKIPCAEHWHIAENFEAPDTFQKLTAVVPCHPNHFFSGLQKILLGHSSSFSDLWKGIQNELKDQKKEYFKNIAFSDLKAFWQISQNVPSHTQLHFANSMAIRYGQFFTWPETTRIYANRGVSGIDGCVSTAVGSSMMYEGFTTVITGDLAMLYDSHSLWIQLPAKFRIIVLNNGGGSIFRIIDGPGKHPDYRDYFETPNQLTLSYLAEMHGLQYLKADNEEELIHSLNEFYDEKGTPIILEIFTDQEMNVKEFKSFMLNAANSFN